ncbi:tripartite tricarboxylate transporter family receptor [Bordetella bronchiseptica B18-5 (C3)]|uniref:Bug family tripartite tricarboxylate transporter substrate binding protein n=1 Tax=Bordetella bronchiseptica TaxID=518 RepID=UPI000460D9F9|nr:tripartite tricarboxylate transporter substrate binding protein [Bordetella bronchiseptica]AZW10914.1 tripartite tricarboxylate transporter substrate binding protein [Bordetella bronchiseptica]KDB62883.1 tripartite tricarboxylate transporter family receptor [Bordetella bronchiseptica B18-5 (C3)]KDC70856.1 tripartite tricarboxylate transporter family receptor [Bordetella bronchiseptica MBORD624]KDD05741.1 tripartite tricarboxylate transporter family receptor [Bordetella bronchiseptica MBORD69
MTLRFASLAAALCILAPQVHATQAYPDKPVRIIVPWTPGQATDVAARAAGEKLAAALGQPFIVENRAGAGGTIGATAVAKSEADGYTLLAGSSGSVTVNPLLMKSGFSPSDLEPAGLVAKVPYVLVTSSDFPAKTAQELIDLLRKSPEKYTFASSGNGSIGHLTAEVFMDSAGIKAQHIPYKGSAAALTDVLSGQVSFMWDSVASVAPHVKSGRARAYAVSSAQRSASMPDVPVLAEVSEIKGFDMVAWVGLMAPKGTPEDRLERINQALLESLRASDVAKQFVTLGIDPYPASRQEARKVLAAENQRVSEMIQRLGITPQ